MTWPARIDRLLAGFVLGTFGLAASLAVPIAAAEWVWRQAVGSNVLHAWLEPAAMLAGVAGLAALSLALAPRAAGAAARGPAGAAALALGACLVAELAWLDVAAARSAWYPWLSLLVPVLVAVLLLLVAACRALLPRTAGAAGTAGGDVLPGEGAAAGLALPMLAIAGSVVALALGGGRDGVTALPQFAWNVLAGTDFGAVVFACLALGLLQAGGARPAAPEPEGGSSGPRGLGVLAAALLPFGFVPVWIALVTGVRFAELWAVALAPLLLVGVAGAWLWFRRPPAGAGADLPLVPALAVGLPVALVVVLGYGRPVEAASLAVLGTAIVQAWRVGWRQAGPLVAPALGLAALASGRLAVWVLGGVSLLAATGLLGAQARVAGWLQHAGPGAVAAGGALLALVALLGRWLPVPGALLVALPLAMPWLGVLGVSGPAGALFLSLAAGLAGVLAAAGPRLDRVTGGLWLAGVAAALAVLAVPSVLLGYAQQLRFW